MEKRQQPAGELIAKISDAGECVEFYQDDDGDVSTLSCVRDLKNSSYDYTHAVVCHSPVFYIKKTVIALREGQRVHYDLMILTGASKYHPDTAEIKVLQMELFGACFAEAQKNAALQAAYRPQYKVYSLKDNDNQRMLEDMSKWLNDLVYMPREKANDSGKKRSLFWSLFGKQG